MERVSKEDNLFEQFLRLRERFTVEELVLVFTRTKAEAFESLRAKFFDYTTNLEEV